MMDILGRGASVTRRLYLKLPIAPRCKNKIAVVSFSAILAIKVRVPHRATFKNVMAGAKALVRVTTAIKLHRANVQDLKVQIGAAFARGNTVFCPMDQRGFLGRGDVGSHLVWSGQAKARRSGPNIWRK